MGAPSDKYWRTQLDDEALRRRDQPSFHAFAEGMHSDVRGQIRNLPARAEFALPSDSCPQHVFILIGLRGEIEARLAGDTVNLRLLSQLVVLPGVSCQLVATSDAAVEVISFLATPAAAPTAG